MAEQRVERPAEREISDWEEERENGNRQARLSGGGGMWKGGGGKAERRRGGMWKIGGKVKRGNPNCRERGRAETYVETWGKCGN